MNQIVHPAKPPSTFAVALAFGLLYTSWSTTFFAIRLGVHSYHLPPGLFAGVRLLVAGLVLLAFLSYTEPQRVFVSWRELFWIAWSGVLLFVGGNGLMTVAMDELPSGTAAIFTAATPLWLALMETIYPPGDKLTRGGWAGLALGLAGVIMVFAPQVQVQGLQLRSSAPVILLFSTILWALGSLVVRYKQRGGSHLASASLQMIIGGGVLIVVGLAAGEGEKITMASLTPGAVGSFVYLVIVGSLIGFTAFNWLLGHVRAAMVGTYAYVNPVLAVILGAVLGGETLAVSTIGGMAVILTGVALVRAAGVKKPEPLPEPEPCPVPVTETV